MYEIIYQSIKYNIILITITYIHFCPNWVFISCCFTKEERITIYLSLRWWTDECVSESTKWIRRRRRFATTRSTGDQVSHRHDFVRVFFPLLSVLYDIIRIVVDLREERWCRRLRRRRSTEETVRCKTCCVVIVWDNIGKEVVIICDGQKLGFGRFYRYWEMWPAGYIICYYLINILNTNFF